MIVYQKIFPQWPKLVQLGQRFFASTTRKAKSLDLRTPGPGQETAPELCMSTCLGGFCVQFLDETAELQQYCQSVEVLFDSMAHLGVVPRHTYYSSSHCSFGLLPSHFLG